MSHASSRPSRQLRSLVAAIALFGTACSEDSPSSAPDLGAVVVRVRDEQAAPVVGAAVRIELPNASGGVYEVGSTTRADGSWTVTAVPAGSRRVTVTPPAGYAPGSEPLVRVVGVRDGQTTTVDVVLRRASGMALGSR